MTGLVEMGQNTIRVLAIASHPVQYMSQIFRRLSARPDVELSVVYLSLGGAEATYDPGFGTTVKWDIPLLDGYEWTHVPPSEHRPNSILRTRNGRLWKLIRKGQFDAALCFTGYRCSAFWTALLAAKLSRTGFLFGTDSIALAPRDGKEWKKAIKTFFWPLLYRLADQVIVPSSGSRDLMLSLGLRTDRVTVTPYSVDNDWWLRQASLADRTATRSAWNVSPDSTVVLFCAKLQPWKRPLDLLYAFGKADIPGGVLAYAGEGPMRSRIESEARILGISDRIRFLGFVNQSGLPAVYCGADLMVLPSEYEPFGVVVNEAMCCGCPVVSTDNVGAARDLIAPIRPSFVYPCGDVEALAAILRSADPALLKNLRPVYRGHILGWSPEQNVSATIHAIRQAISHVVGHRADDSNGPGRIK
jgi:glycosyltransferase involved in cell wall biosynthesis